MEYFDSEFLPSAGLAPDPELNGFGDSGLESLWPDDWTTTIPSDDFVISASAVPKPASARIPAPNGPTNGLAGPSTSAEELKAKCKHRKEANKVQASPTRENFSEIKNTIPSTTTPTLPIPPIQAAADGVRPAANGQNARANPGATEPLPKFYRGNAPTTQLKANTSPRGWQNKSVHGMGAPRRDTPLGRYDTPLPTFTDEEKEVMLKEYHAMFDAVLDAGFDAMKARAVASIVRFDAPFPTFSKEEMALKVKQFNASLEEPMPAEPEAATPMPIPVPTSQEASNDPVASNADSGASVPNYTDEDLEKMLNEFCANLDNIAAAAAIPAEPPAAHEASNNPVASVVDPGVTLTNEDMESMSNAFKAKFDAAELEAMMSMPTQAPTVQEASYDPVAPLADPDALLPTFHDEPSGPMLNDFNAHRHPDNTAAGEPEPITAQAPPAQGNTYTSVDPVSRKRKLEYIAENDTLESYGVVGSPINGGMAGHIENAAPFGRADSSEAVGCPRDTELSEGMTAQSADPVTSAGVARTSGGAGSPGDSQKLWEWYCDFCELRSDMRYSSKHTKLAACRNNKVKYAFIHGAPPSWFTPLRGHHGSQGVPRPKPEGGEELECYKCEEPCARRKVIWEDYVRQNPKKKASNVLADLAQYHAPKQYFPPPELNYDVAANLAKQVPVVPTPKEGPVTPPRPKKARRTAKKASAVDPPAPAPQPQESAPGPMVWYTHSNGMSVPYILTPVPGGAQGGMPQAPHPVNHQNGGSFTFAGHAGVQAVNQNVPVAGPSSYTQNAVPAAAGNAAPYGNHGSQYHPHPQQPAMNTVPMDQTNQYFVPNQAAPNMGNAYHHVQNHAATAPMMNAQAMGNIHGGQYQAAAASMVNAQAMGNAHHAAQYHAAASPMMNQQAHPTTNETYDDYSQAAYMNQYYEAGGM